MIKISDNVNWHKMVLLISTNWSLLFCQKVNFALRLLCPSIVILFYSGIAIIPTQVLLLCSFHDWENTSNSELLSVAPRSSSSLLSLMVRMLLSWCWWSSSEFSELTPSNLFAAMWQFMHLAIIPHSAQMLLACNYCSAWSTQASQFHQENFDSCPLRVKQHTYM